MQLWIFYRCTPILLFFYITANGDLRREINKVYIVIVLQEGDIGPLQSQGISTRPNGILISFQLKLKYKERNIMMTKADGAKTILRRKSVDFQTLLFKFVTGKVDYNPIYVSHCESKWVSLSAISGMPLELGIW